MNNKRLTSSLLGHISGLIFNKWDIIADKVFLLEDAKYKLLGLSFTKSVVSFEVMDNVTEYTATLRHGLDFVLEHVLDIPDKDVINMDWKLLREQKVWLMGQGCPEAKGRQVATWLKVKADADKHEYEKEKNDEQQKTDK